MKRSAELYLAAVVAGELAGALAAAGVLAAAVLVTNVLTGTDSPDGASAVLTWAVRLWMLLCLVLMFFALGLVGALVYVRIAKPDKPERAGRLFGAVNLIPGAAALLFILSALSALRNFDSGPAWDLPFILAGLAVTLPLAAVGLLVGGAVGGRAALEKRESATLAARDRAQPRRGR